MGSKTTQLLTATGPIWTTWTYILFAMAETTKYDKINLVSFNKDVKYTNYTACSTAVCVEFAHTVPPTVGLQLKAVIFEVNTAVHGGL